MDAKRRLLDQERVRLEHYSCRTEQQQYVAWVRRS